MFESSAHRSEAMDSERAPVWSQEAGRSRSLVELAFVSLVGVALEAQGLLDRDRHAPRPDAAAPPGSADDALSVARQLASADLSSMTDDELLDAVVGWQRVASWADAAQAQAVGELLARGGASSQAAEAVTHELTAALTTSRYTAGKLVGRAVGLSASPRVAEALTQGRIDTARADVLLSGTTVPLAVRKRVVDELVGTADNPGPASDLTPARLRDLLRRAAITSDPDDARHRAAAAVAERHVWVEPAPDQMAWLTALLPAQDAASIWARIDAGARCTVRTPGEVRTVAQARADVLTQLVITDAADQAVGVSGSSGPAGRASGGRAGAASGGPAGRASGGRAGAASGGPAGRASGASTGAAPGVSAVTGEGTDDDRAIDGARVAMVRSVVNVTIPATALLGLDEAPGELAGYGPIPASVARALAADGDSTWRRIVTDPVTGVATDVSRTAYRPGAVLGEFVRTRDPLCTFPGCQVPSTRCDLDHMEPFDARSPNVGQTRASNLHPVCRAHHNAKTHGGWSTARTDGGAVRWSAPSGRAYDVPPSPSDTHLTSRAPGAPRALEDDEPPPF